MNKPIIELAINTFDPAKKFLVTHPDRTYTVLSRKSWIDVFLKFRDKYGNPDTMNIGQGLSHVVFDFNIPHEKGLDSYFWRKAKREPSHDGGYTVETVDGADYEPESWSFEPTDEERNRFRLPLWSSVVTVWKSRKGEICSSIE